MTSRSISSKNLKVVESFTKYYMSRIQKNEQSNRFLYILQKLVYSKKQTGSQGRCTEKIVYNK